MKIINYTSFETNDQFVKWQKENSVNVITVSPLMMKMDLSVTEEDQNEKSVSEGSANLTAGIFVTYVIED